jgi:hypothetical protein
VQLLLRILGLNFLAQVGTRLPNVVVRTISTLVLIAANLLPIKAVLDGSLGLGDVFVLYWLENVIVYLTTNIQLRTAAHPDEFTSTFFAIHYGIFTVVHGVFAFVLAALSGGFLGGWFYWIVVLAAMVFSDVLSVGINWFARGERLVVSPARVAVAPYPRMLVMHGAIIAGAFLVFDPRHSGPQDSMGGATLAVVILCGAKTVIDLVFHIVERILNNRLLTKGLAA